LDNGTKLSLDQYISLVSDWEEAMVAEKHAWRRKRNNDEQEMTTTIRKILVGNYLYLWKSYYYD
jgi:hypothetical protein